MITLALKKTALRQLSFPVPEYRARVDRVQRVISERGFDALLVHGFPSICYLTGIESVLWFKYFLVVVPRAGEPILLGQDFEMYNALTTAWTTDHVAYHLGEDYIAATARLLKKRGLAAKRLGIELNRWSLSVPDYRRLRTTLRDAKLVETTSLMEDVKAIKSPAEIAVMRRAARLSDAGMKAAIDETAEGKTDNDVAAAAYEVLIRGGSEYMSLDPIVTVGARSSIPHSTHRRVRMKRGDSALLEMGACFHRYTAAIMRTVSIGKPTDRLRRRSDACIASLNTVIENMKAGAVSGEIAAKADKAWRTLSRRLVWHGIYAYSQGLTFPPD